MRKQSNSLVSIFILWFIVAIFLMASIVFLFVPYAEGHENDEFVHSRDGVIDIVRMRSCPDGAGIREWRTGNGKSYLIIFNHGQLHMREGTCEDL